MRVETLNCLQNILDGEVEEHEPLQLVGKSAEGGDGVGLHVDVVVVEDESLGNAGKDDGFPTSVLRELSHLKSLDSPYVAKVIQAEVNDKVVQICFEHGMNLKDYVRRHSSKTEGLTLPQIKSITKQILIALMFCHSKGLMHRNLKPDNILVSDSGQVKICDFTLSRIGV